MKKELSDDFSLHGKFRLSWYETGINQGIRRILKSKATFQIFTGVCHQSKKEIFYEDDDHYTKL